MKEAESREGSVVRNNDREHDEKAVMMDDRNQNEISTDNNNNSNNVKNTNLPLYFKQHKLAKFLFLLGNIAMELLAYIERKENELKKLRNKKENARFDINNNDEANDDLSEALGI